MGAYNPDWGKDLGFNNRLQKAIGYEGHTSVSTDFGAKGRDSIVISPPDGMSDTTFINLLGREFNEIEDNQNYIWWGNTKNSRGYSNSNNFVYQLGNNVGVGNQVKAFNPSGITPGFNQGLAPGGLPSISASIRNSALSLLNKVEKRLKQLKSKSN